MHGLVFVTWEHYLSTRFGSPLLAQYRATIGETNTSPPLVTQIYDDTYILAGVKAATQLTGLPTDTLLREYGRYFMLNGLTSHLCAYLLNNVHNARDLLLTMRQAHAQIRRLGPQVSPPLFTYEFSPADAESLVCVYDSPRQLCALLVGAIEGAAERYGEEVTLQETSCMKRGAAACRFSVRFRHAAAPGSKEQQSQRQERWRAQQEIAELVYAVLPERDGSTLAEIYERVRQQQRSSQQTRLHQVFEALNQLQQTGWATSTAAQSGMQRIERRYWRLAEAPSSRES
jgi:hypothetical protein